MKKNFVNINKEYKSNLLESKLTSNSAITLITLVITIIILLILAGITLNMLIGENGLLNKAQIAKNKTNENQAAETLNLKITNIQINSYAENKKLPSLQYVSDKLCDDNDIEYVQKQSKKTASLDKIDVSDVSSIYTKLKEYPYEFEINSSLQLASIDGVEISKDDTNSNIKCNEDLENWLNTLDDKNLTLEDIIDNNLLQRLMNNKKSVDYMFSNEKILNSVLKSKYAMEAMGKSEYAGYVAITNKNYREKVLNSEFIDKFDNGSVSIPKLTSNNKNIEASSEYNQGYNAFDRNNSTCWLSNDTTQTEYIEYNFEKNVIPYKIEITNIKYNYYYRCKDVSIQGSKDHSSYENLIDLITIKDNDNVQKFNVNNIKECQYVKLNILNKYTTGTFSSGIAEMQVYCREVPNL